MARATRLTENWSAETIGFPIDPELLEARQTARQLERRQGPQADRYWKTECSRLYARLQATGMSESDIKAEVDRFALAVHAEMQRAAWAKYALKVRRPPGNGAA